MPLSSKFFEELESYTLADLTLGVDDTFTVTALDNDFQRQTMLVGCIDDLASLHHLLPASLKLSSEAYFANTATRRSNLFADEAKAAFDLLRYGDFEITNLESKVYKGVNIRSIKQHERLMGEAQSFRILLEQVRFKTKKVGGARVPFVINTSNIHIDVSAVELDTRFPGWTVRYMERKALGTIDDLMVYVFNPLAAKLYAANKDAVKKAVTQRGIAETLILPPDIYMPVFERSDQPNI